MQRECGMDTLVHFESVVPCVYQFIFLKVIITKLTHMWQRLNVNRDEAKRISAVATAIFGAEWTHDPELRLLGGQTLNATAEVDVNIDGQPVQSWWLSTTTNTKSVWPMQIESMANQRGR